MIQWTNDKRRLGDLVPWPRNPRQIKEQQAKRLVESFGEFGQVETLAVGPDNEIYNGHQRLNALRVEHGPDYEVDVRVSSRPLTEREREKLTVYLHKGAAGEWDFDVLANEFDLGDLLDWGFEPVELGLGDDEPEADSSYSQKIEAPIYEPKGSKPKVTDLYDDSRTRELLADIDTSDLPEAEKEFLRVAARRHTVLNYQRIADYYAHSDETVQRLMEDSALIIIDFNRAIELGYVKLTDEIAAQYFQDYGDA